MSGGGDHKYGFLALRRHTRATVERSAVVTGTFEPGLQEAFAEFSAFVEEMQGRPASLDRNVRLLLACRMLNHVYAGILLAEAGLFADAVVCERSALEVLAAYRLLCLKPQVAEMYAKGEFPRPVEVRRALEAAGHGSEATRIRDLYQSASGVTHVSRDAERFGVRWETDIDGRLLFGGAYERRDLEELLRFLPAMLHWFRIPLDAVGN